ncbi:DsrE family protein [Oleidesulfovibrio sp.]|uniref:DsrE family protein n=1 Tax=Oleidesulfovibrio sp. TaxID=2909707 RepID=UPI003A83DC6F
MSTGRKLFIIWSSSDPEVAHNLVFMYGGNSRPKGWWDEVRIIAWGPSARLLAEDPTIQAELPRLRDAGVELWACRACADNYGVADRLEALGLDVLYVGEPVTHMIQTGWSQLTF